MNSTHNQKLKEGYRKVTLDYNPKLFVTLTTNQPLSVAAMRRLIGRYMARMDRLHLGRNWKKRSAAERIDGIFFIESVYTNTHTHALLKVPYGNRMGLQLASDEIWAKLCPSGSVRIKPIYNLNGLYNYVTKEDWKTRFFEEQLVFATEFMGS